MRITPDEIKERKLFRYYRLVRKWAAYKYDIKEADVELLIYLEDEGLFTLEDYKKGVFIYAWDKKRWDRLRNKGMIDVWRHRNHTTQKYTIFKVSYKAKRMTYRIYNILLGNEEIPVKEASPFYKNASYTDKVCNQAIHEMKKYRENELED